MGSIFTVLDDSSIRRSIALAAPQANHRVLSVGYSAEILDALAKAAPVGLVEAVDEPKTIEKARKKYAEAIDGGHLNVAEGDENHLPFAQDFFDRVIVVERFERWMDPIAGLAEAKRVLRPDGVIVIALRKLEKGTIKREAAKLNDIAKAADKDEAMLAAMREAGFIKCAIEQERFAVARKPLNFATDAART